MQATILSLTKEAKIRKELLLNLEIFAEKKENWQKTVAKQKNAGNSRFTIEWWDNEKIESIQQEAAGIY